VEFEQLRNHVSRLNNCENEDKTPKITNIKNYGKNLRVKEN
jgi:hypothetical protein